jgi:hypothetical protein
MSKYEKLDAEIVKEIGAGRNTFSTMRGLVWEFARQVAPRDRWGRMDEGRVVDRRLQALRKRGLLRYQYKRWSVCAHNTHSPTPSSD